jgi:hypothetical protein
MTENADSLLELKYEIPQDDELPYIFITYGGCYRRGGKEEGNC